MKVLVILAVAGVCVALPQGFLLDTPEVIAEKQRFFQLYNAAAAAAAAAPDDNEIHRQAASTSSFHSVAAPNNQWTGPLASSVPAGVNGNFAQVQDTAEVAAAKQAFQNAFQQQVRATSSGSNIHNSFSHQPAAVFSSPPQLTGWTGPVAATIPAGLPGSVNQVPNTPEVEAAIAEFTRVYNSAVQNTVVGNRQHQRPSFSHSSQTSSPSFSHSSQKSSPSFSHPNAIHEPSQAKWAGPFAATVPAGLPGSAQVQDTPEVAAAKAQFQRAFQQQLVYSG